MASLRRFSEGQAVWHLKTGKEYIIKDKAGSKLRDTWKVSLKGSRALEEVWESLLIDKPVTVAPTAGVPTTVSATQSIPTTTTPIQSTTPTTTTPTENINGGSDLNLIRESN